MNNSKLFYDKIIIGAGIYGLYAALYCCKRGQTVLVLECDTGPFKRASFVNQARVHQGYHYPRSISTAIKSASYFDRFCKDYGFCINDKFDQIYATSSNYSWTNKNQFMSFCKNANIPCKEINPNNYFKKGVCDGAFLTREYTYDAMLLKSFFVNELAKYKKQVQIEYSVRINNIERENDSYVIIINDNMMFCSKFVLNATYAGINQIINIVKFEQFKIKYELCEIILCETNEKLSKKGFTVMDGPFFSIMPFGKTGYHSLTSVTFTPHQTSFYKPNFMCQNASKGYCDNNRFGNCNDCSSKPHTSFSYMANLAKKYLLDEYKFVYKKSLFSIKPICINSEVDDSRPTIVLKHSNNPTFVSVLSGKINTVYDLDEVLSDDE